MHAHVPCCDSRHHSRSCVNLVFGQPDSNQISQKVFLCISYPGFGSCQSLDRNILEFARVRHHIDYHGQQPQHQLNCRYYATLE